VLYAHDCGGPGAAAAAWGERLSREGYVVIAPDSRARSDGATARCPSSGAAPLATREGEIRYALRQVRLLPWVRQSAVFLLAVGEGATAAARDDTLAVTGSIVVGETAQPARGAPSLQLEGAGVPDEAESRRAIEFLRRLAPR
jgi:dienelactone hydrolase